MPPESATDDANRLDELASKMIAEATSNTDPRILSATVLRAKIFQSTISSAARQISLGRFLAQVG